MAIILRIGLHASMAEWCGHRDELDIGIKHVASDGAINAMRKDGQSRAAGQVGKKLADTGRAWMRLPPLRQGQALRAWRGRDPLGLRCLLPVN